MLWGHQSQGWTCSRDIEPCGGNIQSPRRDQVLGHRAWGDLLSWGTLWGQSLGRRDSRAIEGLGGVCLFLEVPPTPV